MADLSKFNPNSAGQRSNTIFGLPFTEDDAELVLLPVPWEVTTSYRGGTSHGPEQIKEAALQVDLYDADAVDVWKKGIYMLPVNKQLKKESDRLKKEASKVIAHLEEGADNNDVFLKETIHEINTACSSMVDWVEKKATELISSGKKVALVGGDHSTPLGFIRALANHHKSFGILQIDAHADLREAYEDFTYSHASIMYNVLNEVPQVSKLVQVGIRDYCDEEVVMIRSNTDRIATWFDQDIKEREYDGTTWRAICENIINDLPQKVYISFDIDGLDPKLCPNTGTPVPGGFELEQVLYLFKAVIKSGRELIGFDLNEVSSGDGKEETIDSIVGARALYKMCNLMLAQ